LRKQLDETAVSDTLQQIQFLNNDMEFKKKLSTYFTSYVAEELKETESGVLKEEDKLQPVILPDGTPNLLRFIPQNPNPNQDPNRGLYYYEKPSKEFPFGRYREDSGP